MNQPEQIHFIHDAIRQVISGGGSILPELVLVAAIILLLVLDMLRASKRMIQIVSLLLVAVASYFTYDQFNLPAGPYFEGSILLRPLVIFLKLGFLLSLALSLFLFKQNNNERPAITNMLFMAAVLGANIMVVSANYLTMFIAIEMLSISSYLLVSIGGSKLSYEASIKYLLFGAMVTAVLLYGISLLYGITGTLQFQQGIGLRNILALGTITMIILALSFKMGLVPMHLWLPDVYEAAPAPVVAFFSFVPKLAGMGLLIVWLQALGLWGDLVIKNLLTLLALISILVGTLSAIWQQSPKRLIAYSSIAQAGFMLLGIIASSDFGIRSLVFFSIIYLIMSYLVFYLIEVMEQRKFTSIAQYSGTAQAYLPAAIAMVVVMLSLTGLPPTAGFTGKMLLFSSFWLALDGSLLWVTFFVAIFSAVIGLFFYLKIPYFMIFKKENSATSATQPLSHYEKVIIGTFSISLVFLFLKSDFLLNFINSRIFVP